MNELCYRSRAAILIAAEASSSGHSATTKEDLCWFSLVGFDSGYVLIR